MKKLKDMKNGDTCYTVPWAMCVKNNQVWLNDDYRADDSSHGTFQMIVKKENEHYIVDIRNCRDDVDLSDEKEFFWGSKPLLISEIIEA